MPQTSIASIIRLMRLSDPARTIIIAIVLVGVTGLPTKAFPGHQKQVSTPPGHTKESSSRQPKPTPAKRPGKLIEYRNEQYGLCITLPEGWQGYSIGEFQWLGISNLSHSDVAVQQGPTIYIRHPEWTKAKPRQDIPIMVFTHAQWRSLQHKEFHIASAAPIGPSELGHNRKYVFALPARYNYAFPTGWEEVAQILRSNPFCGECQARGDQH